MRTIRLFLCLLAVVLVGRTSVANAEIYLRAGVVPVESIPRPSTSQSVVRLDVPHIRQAPDLCVPTSAAMILKYFGTEYDPRKLKELAEQGKPRELRNATFTLYSDLVIGLHRIDIYWRQRSYADTNEGFAQGIAEIEDSLRSGNPVMIDVHLALGHTFVLMGFDAVKRVVYIRDPDIPASSVRVLSYDVLRQSWNNHRFGRSRSALFSHR